MNNTNSKLMREAFAFSALDPYLQQDIILPTETKSATRSLVEWGTRNAYPEYLLDLYNNVPTLRSIINGNIDYITGDDITIAPLPSRPDGTLNKKGETAREIVRLLAKDWEIYGGYAVQIIRNLLGEVAEIYYLDMRFVRMNKECNVFYYKEDWTKRGAATEYPAFMPNLEWGKLSDEEKNRHASSVLFVKNVHTQVYPAPIYAASVKACEIERMIDDFHISDLCNHFTSSAIINFNNGVPEDELKEQMEHDINEKFAGANNGGRIMLSWNPNKESATDIQEFKVEDFGERYKALSEHSRQQIFTAFHAIPLLFGLTAGTSTGFSTEEFEQSFLLYNKTQILPIQRTIGDTFDRIYGQKEVLSIVPFSLTSENKIVK